MKLYCFPFAGGNRYSYRLFEQHCPAGLDLVPLDLPGHGSRWNEALLGEVGAMVDDLEQQIGPELQAPYAFYGHSMGTLLCYLLTQRLRSKKRALPTQLILSGRGGPQLKRNEEDPYTYKLPQEEFVEKLREMGGCPEELLADPNFLKLYEPILRSDFRAVETFEYPLGLDPLELPITVMIGREENTSYEDAELWQNETTNHIVIREFSGRHFFIYEHAASIMQMIGEVLLVPSSISYSIRK